MVFTVILSPEPAKRGLVEPWLCAVPLDPVAITDPSELCGRPAMEVMRWEDDEWEIISGAAEDVPKVDRRVILLRVVLALDPSIEAAAQLAVGSVKEL